MSGRRERKILVSTHGLERKKREREDGGDGGGEVGGL